MTLAKYAVNEENSQGRQHPEPPPQDRNEFQRDRDRIIHSTAFRRLEYKTQVFVNHEGDLYRTRLTHSLEVAQIARSVARNLALNEDLTEAIALAHDLGHTPFGHAGQEALNACMHEYGGFEHNLQSLRVVDFLEQRYARFDGLNLSFEAREGILKHCSTQNAKTLGAIGQRFLENKRPSLEAQLTDVADALAYNNHDIDDGLRSNILKLDVLLEHQLFKDLFNNVTKKYPRQSNRIIISETIRTMIHTQVADLIKNSCRLIDQANPSTLTAVREHDKYLIAFSSDMQQQHLKLKKILLKHLYQHPKVKIMSQQSQRIIQTLFKYYWQHPELLPQKKPDSEQKLARACADYIASMTDRFATMKFDNVSSQTDFTHF